jgi:hypothetical protein
VSVGTNHNAGRGLDGRKDRWVSAARCKHRKAKLQVGWHQGRGDSTNETKQPCSVCAALASLNRVRMAWAPARHLQRNNFTLGPGCCIVRSPLSPSDNRSEQTSFSDSTFVNLSSTSWVPAISRLVFPKMAATPSRQRASTPSTPLLSTFQKHIEDMRNLVLCKVCIKPLYEPYNLGCGHTYCYTCLANWFGGANKRKRKTCPDCRAQVTAQPAPNYLVGG